MGVRRGGVLIVTEDYFLSYKKGKNSHTDTQ